MDPNGKFYFRVDDLQSDIDVTKDKIQECEEQGFLITPWVDVEDGVSELGSVDPG